jgi:hypothetical protein
LGGGKGVHAEIAEENAQRKNLANFASLGENGFFLSVERRQTVSRKDAKLAKKTLRCLRVLCVNVLEVKADSNLKQGVIPAAYSR